MSLPYGKAWLCATNGYIAVIIVYYYSMIMCVHRLGLVYRNGKRGQQGWESKYVVLDGTKVSVFDGEPREGQYLSTCLHLSHVSIGTVPIISKNTEPS